MVSRRWPSLLLARASAPLRNARQRSRVAARVEPGCSVRPRPGDLLLLRQKATVRRAEQWASGGPKGNWIRHIHARSRIYRIQDHQDPYCRQRKPPHSSASLQHPFAGYVGGRRSLSFQCCPASTAFIPTISRNTLIHAGTAANRSSNDRNNVKKVLKDFIYFCKTLVISTLDLMLNGFESR